MEDPDLRILKDAVDGLEGSRQHNHLIEGRMFWSGLFGVTNHDHRRYEDEEQP